VEAPQIEEHPVAFAIYIRSPNNCVINLAYGVSPQPAQAPENSNNGCSNWLPLTVNLSRGFSFLDTVIAYSQLAASAS